MKIQLLFLSFLFTSLMLGCSDDDDTNNSNNNSNIEYSPPSWIIGTWILEESIQLGITTVPKWKFTNNDYILIAPGGIETNYTQLVRSSSQTDAFLYDNLSGNEYSITWSTGDGIQATNTYQRIDNQRINWVEGSTGFSEAIHIKQ